MGVEPINSGFADHRLTAWLRRQKKWSGKRGLNPRQLAWQASALPTELFPLSFFVLVYKSLAKPGFFVNRKKYQCRTFLIFRLNINGFIIRQFIAVGPGLLPGPFPSHQGHSSARASRIFAAILSNSSRSGFTDQSASILNLSPLNRGITCRCKWKTS